MNNAVKEFLDFITNPDMASFPDSYIGSRKISDNDLILTVQYVNGGAYISGYAFGRVVAMRYNVFNNPNGFDVVIDHNKCSRLPLTIDNVKHFFTTGEFFVGSLDTSGKQL